MDCAVPGEGEALRGGDALPVGVALEDVGVAAFEHFARDVFGDEVLDFFVRGPDVLEEDGLAVGARAERLGGEVFLHGAGERVGDDERRRGEVVGLHVGRDAAFEVAIAGEDGGGDEAVLVDGLRDGGAQRAGISDAGGAAEADDVEADGVERFLQAGLFEVVGDDLRSGRERGFHPRRGLQALGDGVARESAGADEDARVGRVGARRDGGDDDVAVAEVEVFAGHGIALCGFAGLFVFGFEGGEEARLGGAERDAAFGALRTGERGFDVAEVEVERGGEDGIGGAGFAVKALGLGEGFDERDAVVRAAGEFEVGEGFLIDREEAAWWRRIRGPCWRWWRGRRASCCRGRGRRIRRTCRRRPSCAASA